MRRRGRRRQQPGSAPADVGTALLEARQAAGVDLTEIQDRTGVPLSQLEALEAGNLSLFPDQRSAVTAVRRYSDLVQVDLEPFDGVVERHWGTALAGFDGGGTKDNGPTTGNRAQSVYLTESVSAAHLSRYPGDGTHLRAFTQTDEVPGVRRSELPVSNGHNGHATFATTGSFPAVHTPYAPPRAVPLVLRGAIWVTVTLLAVAGGGLALQHYQPQLLADIHLVHHSHTTTPTTPGPGATASTKQASTPAHSSVVSLSDTGAASATVAVRASNYSVVVAAWAPCWTEVHTPQSFSPVFAATLQGGQVKVFNPSDGQLTVSMSASLVTVQVRINGKTVPKWLFKPTSVPFTLNFDSTT
jgi:cytoskeletal protein RodZ